MLLYEYLMYKLVYKYTANLHNRQNTALKCYILHYSMGLRMIITNYRVEIHVITPFDLNIYHHATTCKPAS